MSFSATRLTCFALLSAVETDLRHNIETWLTDDGENRVLSVEEEEKARRRRGGVSTGKLTLHALLPYVDFADAFGVLFRHKAGLPEDLTALLDTARSRLDRTTPIRNRVAHTRPMEIDDLSNLLELVEVLASGSARWFSASAATLKRLRDSPSYVLGLTVDLPRLPSSGPRHNLPVPDFDETGFFGRKLQIQSVKTAILGAYPVVSVLGDGGIGKTAVAVKVAYDLLDEAPNTFDAVVWASAKTTTLSVDEIKRINGAIEDSLGLLMRAAQELGATPTDDPFSALLAYMRNFRILLILDNLETVLDQRLREFLLSLPMGSKVIMTSRIGAGVESPVRLGALSDDESARFLRSLVNARDVPALRPLDETFVRSVTKKMGGRPAYIKWFVSGVQSGRRPEDILGQNELFLEFCMSNVYDYLSEDARLVLAAMQVITSPQSQAEVAYLAAFPAETAQAALLELITTNFIQIESHSPGGDLDSKYQLSEFGRTYLNKTHPVPLDRRRRINGKNQELRSLGSRLKVENSTSPYDPSTVSVRSASDFGVAKILRDALVASASGDHARASTLCAEAQALAPTYHETWRVAATLQISVGNYAGGLECYQHAIEFAPDTAPVLFFAGQFLSDYQVDLEMALKYLRAAAKIDNTHAPISMQIAFALFDLENYDDALEAANYVLGLALDPSVRVQALVTALRATVKEIGRCINDGRVGPGVEFLERSAEVVNQCDSLEIANSEALDRLIQLLHLTQELINLSMVDSYIMRKAEQYGETIWQLVNNVDKSAFDRRIEAVQRIPSDKPYGFIRHNRKDLFFHVSDLIETYQWDFLEAGTLVAFVPRLDHARGPRAQRVRWIN